MGKKTYEFRPDKERSGIIDKLYLTRKQRLSALKWLLYCLVMLAASVLQDVMLCRLDLLGGTTDLVPCVILTVCIIEGAESGCVFSLAGAALFQFSGSAPGYHVIALIPLLAVLASIFRQNYLRKGLSATVLCAGAAVMLYELTVFAAALFATQTLPARITAAAVTGGLSVLAIPVLYPILTSISKIGGETWKE